MFALQITGFSHSPQAIIDELRGVLGLSHQEAEDAILGALILKSNSLEECVSLKERLEALGATVQLIDM